MNEKSRVVLSIAVFAALAGPTSWDATIPTLRVVVQRCDECKRNSIKHGIFSRVALLKGESRAEFDALLNGLRENLQPEGALEENAGRKAHSARMASASTDYRGNR